jgi:ubiquinone/menaquinone biosynthesis C-methylase UbiE
VECRKNTLGEAILSEINKDVTWDYTERARHYHKRPDYDFNAIRSVLSDIEARPGTTVADVGAGTGKLTVSLAGSGLKIIAIEPNDSMMAGGIQNTAGMDVIWRKGTAEATGLDGGSVDAVFFGSSFNVVRQPDAMLETARILKENGWMVCLWNHRDLNDPLQSKVENAIRSYIPGYDYGDRRKDPTEKIGETGLFGPVKTLQASFTAQVRASDWLEAWESHATLQKQAGDAFDGIIARIRELVGDTGLISVPYTTRIWYAALRNRNG